MRWQHLWIPLLMISSPGWAQNIAPAPLTPKPGQVLVTGTVADEGSKAAILARLRELYGTEKVVDQIAIGPVVMPANWSNYVQKLINPNLKLIRRGQLKIDGNTISVRGEVANEAQRQHITSAMATHLNPTYTVKNGLHVLAAEQNILDAALDNRIIEFETGKTTLTPAGQAILDEMVEPLLKLKDKPVEIIGHTDNQGLRASNLSLSQARADTVKAYLIAQGLDTARLTTSGQGSNRPIANNNSVEGRARNRRIEFRIAQ